MDCPESVGVVDAREIAHRLEVGLGGVVDLGSPVLADLSSDLPERPRGRLFEQREDLQPQLGLLVSQPDEFGAKLLVGHQDSSEVLPWGSIAAFFAVTECPH
jgi:hypothetical protein